MYVYKRRRIFLHADDGISEIFLSILWMLDNRLNGNILSQVLSSIPRCCFLQLKSFSDLSSDFQFPFGRFDSCVFHAHRLTAANTRETTSEHRNTQLFRNVSVPIYYNRRHGLIRKRLYYLVQLLFHESVLQLVQ